jgi:hypothetical protein
MQLSSEALSFHAVQRTYLCARNRTYLKIDLYFKEVRIILRTGSTPRAGCRVCLCSFELYVTLYENKKTVNWLRSIHLIRNEMFQCRIRLFLELIVQMGDEQLGKSM